MNWDLYRRVNRSINLTEAAKAWAHSEGLLFTETAQNYLLHLEELWPIYSRQAAAIAIVTALHIGEAPCT